MHKIIVITIGFLLVVILPSCGVSQITVLNDLSLVLQLDQSHGEVGKPIEISFTVIRTKSGGPPLGLLEAPEGEPVIDIIAGDGVTVWSVQQPPDRIPHSLNLAPGESTTIRMIWIPGPELDRQRVTISGILRLKGVTGLQPTQIQLPIGETRF